ncbi:hypothetical protein D3C73_1334900 [compost metagenome]
MSVVPIKGQLFYRLQGSSSEATAFLDYDDSAEFQAAVGMEKSGEQEVADRLSGRSIFHNKMQ